MTSEIPLEDWTIRDFDIKNVSGDMPQTPKLKTVCLEEELPLVLFPQPHQPNNKIENASKENWVLWSSV